MSTAALRRIILCLCFAMFVPRLAAETLSAERIGDLTRQNTRAAIELYREFLSLPNDANNPDDILALLDWMEPQFSERGFETRRLSTAGSPLLFASRAGPAAAPTVLVYLQADGQPVDPSAWFQDDPYRAVLKERQPDGNWEIISWNSMQREIDADWRVFARSASDSKGPMTQFLVAMDILKQAGASLPFELKVIVDTEEELGSPHLPAALVDNRALLAADMLLIFDGPPHASNRPTVAFGARGIATVTLTAYGPRSAQHSGHYGNYVPNPAFHLARILAAMKDADGRVLLPGFYDGIEIDDALLDQLAAVPDDEAAIRSAIGIADADKVAGSLQQALQYPSLNIRGLSSGWVGRESRTIIPATATAELDLRLVKESDPERLIGLVRSHVEEMGYHVIDHEPTDAERREYEGLVRFESAFSYAAFRSAFDDPPGQMARAGMRNLYGEEPILIRTMGGSIPIAPFVDTLGIPAAIVPTVNIDNNQHSPNENLRLGNFIEGISILASVLSRTAPD
jgi:acetylornithine deacetylase/succinyl-diaminopimelate desuccinylase-like protein